MLRFRLVFPASYPLSPPSVIFGSDVFHPLLTPLTTITYTTGISEREAAHATSHERLPPGSFGLRHGFPEWFDSADNVATNIATSIEGADNEKSRRHPSDIHVVDILRYLRSCFEDEQVLDAVPFDAACNPGAWYAWRAHRASAAQKPAGATRAAATPAPETPAKREGAMSPVRQSPAKREGPMSPSHARNTSNPQNRPRRPSEWNWEGVWEERVKKAIKSSITDPVLFGNSSLSQDEIHFQSVRDEDLPEIHSDMRQHLSVAE